LLDQFLGIFLTYYFLGVSLTATDRTVPWNASSAITAHLLINCALAAVSCIIGVLRFSGRYPAMGISPLPSFHWCPRCPDTPSFWPCGIHLYVDTPRIFDHVIVKSRPLTGAWLLDHTEGLPTPSSPTAELSSNESLCFSLRLCFSNAVCSAPNSWRTRNQRHGFMAGWHWQKLLVPICLYCLKCTKFGQFILRKII